MTAAEDSGTFCLSYYRKFRIIKKGDIMPRTARVKSRTGIYHVMLRGIDRRYIFMNDSDKEKFLFYLFRAKEISEFKLYAYCLMDNHVHILLKENEELGDSIRRITVGYAQWYNNKYGRTGHLFQNRYKSEAIEDEKYFMAAVRYIHQNPVKAKMVKQAQDYEWSSYKDYVDCYNGKSTKIDTELVTAYFATQESFEIFMNQPNEDEFLDYEVKKKYTDKDLATMINNIINVKSLPTLPKKERDKIIWDIYNSTGASIRQLSRVMGIGKSIVESAVKNTEI